MTSETWNSSNEAIRAWEKAYAERSRFLLTADEEALLRAEFDESALMA